MQAALANALYGCVTGIDRDIEDRLGVSSCHNRAYEGKVFNHCGDVVLEH